MMSTQIKTLIDRCCARYVEMANKEFYFIVKAAEDDYSKILRAINIFQVFSDCLENPVIKDTAWLGVWYKGEIQSNPALQEAYEGDRYKNH